MASFTVPVTLVRGTVTGRDPYGQDVRTTTETVVPGCVVWPATSGSEATQGQDVITDTLVCLFPPGTTVSATDWVRFLGLTYEVTGTSFDWESPLTGASRGVQANMRAVTG